MDRQFNHVQSGDIRLRVAVEGEGPLVLMVHGWPESWYSWRHQMGPIAQAGYTAAALDVRGYGGSDRPHPVGAYDMQSIVGDLQAVADRLGGGRAILVGHDWGAPIVWNSALVDPVRFTAVAGLAIPHLGVGKAPFIDIARKLFTDKGRFFYQIYIQDEGVAEAELEADVRGGLRKLYYVLSGDAPAGA
ncbi:MAG: alpha/beta fold hydrolase, partial [Alphaproteobacteria bacterium]|nr:alpha/beta fold hydrolase [Alphaproteobacteria bacterium]